MFQGPTRWIGVVLFLVGYCGLAQAKPLRIHRDLQYKPQGSAAETDQCTLDIYQPTVAKHYPTVIWLHGGGLRHGSKDGSIEQKIAKRLASAGIGCASVDYRLSPQAKFPAAAEDVAAAVAWLQRNVAEYDGNPGALFLAGHSAGGFLAALVGSDPQYLAAHEISPSALRGLIPISGQMATHTTVVEERGLEQPERGKPGTENLARIVDRNSPLFHVRSPSPPQLVVVGGNDLPDREAVNRDYAAALQAASRDDVTLLVVPERDHQSIVSRFDEPGDKVAQAVVEFVSRLTPTELHEVAIGDIQPLTRFGNIYLGGQPSQADLKLLGKHGINTIINLREPSETAWDEAQAAKQLGAQYIALPFRGAEALTDEVFDSAIQSLKKHSQDRVLLHCASSNRVGAIWYAYRVIDGKASQDEALLEAKKVGLRSQSLLQAAEKYVEKQKEKNRD